MEAGYSAVMVQCLLILTSLTGVVYSAPRDSSIVKTIDFIGSRIEVSKSSARIYFPNQSISDQDILSEFYSLNWLPADYENISGSTKSIRNSQYNIWLRIDLRNKSDIEDLAIDLGWDFALRINYYFIVQNDVVGKGSYGKIGYFKKQTEKNSNAIFKFHLPKEEVGTLLIKVSAIGGVLFNPVLSSYEALSEYDRIHQLINHLYAGSVLSIVAFTWRCCIILSFQSTSAFLAQQIYSEYWS